MKDQEINIAVAEACGQRVRGLEWAGNGQYYTKDASGNIFTAYPEYTTDLNAMHEAEKTIKGEQARWEWVEHLSQICRCYEPDMLHATARQRAEAFLRTIGKWKETL